MIDLWTLLVVYMFGSFWIAVLAIAGVMWLIFTICKVSQVTSMNFLLFFILAMAIGYGYSTYAILLTIIFLIMSLSPLVKLGNQ